MRTQCQDCNSSTGLAPYDDGEYCHACNSKKYIKSLIFNSNKIIDSIYKETNVIPADQHDKWPDEAWQYVKKYYLTNALIKHHNIYWSNTVKRIIFPNERRASSCAWGRSLDKHPKWIKYGNPKGIVYPYRTDNTEELVLVEDCISAIRVSQFKDCLSLSGTSIKEGMDKIIQPHKKILIWLDGDIAGIRGAEKIRREFKLYKDVRVINSKRDPKELTNKEIHGFLYTYSG